MKMCPFPELQEGYTTDSLGDQQCLMGLKLFGLLKDTELSCLDTAVV